MNWIEEKDIDNSKKEYHITKKGYEVLMKDFEKREFLLNVADNLLRGGYHE